jgi:hypothetical protein
LKNGDFYYFISWGFQEVILNPACPGSVRQDFGGTGFQPVRKFSRLLAEKAMS